MSTMTRTDRHRPSAAEFNPEDYDFTGVVFDARGDWPEANDHFRAVRAELIEQGYTFSGIHGGTGQCDHCGSLLRYSALMIHRPTRTLIYVGEQCLGNRFDGMTKGEFDKARKAAALNRALQVRKHAFAEMCVDNQDLAYATYAVNIGCAITDNGERWEDRHGKSWGISTLRDIANKAYQYSGISTKQAALVAKILGELGDAEAATADRETTRAAEKAARTNAAIGEIGERRDFTGTIRWFKHFESNFGYTPKTNTLMIIDTPEGTVKWMASSQFELTIGETVTIKATVKEHSLYTPEGGDEADASITTVVTRGKFL